MPAEDLTDQFFGELLVIERTNPPNEKQKTAAWWLCLCSCGNYKTVTGSDLRRGSPDNCGCLTSQKISDGTTIHGEAVGNKTPEYRSWRQMINRCDNPNSPSYDNYGGRGISVCRRWYDYESFLIDMGRRPSSTHSIERINNHGNYEPDNCIWATRQQQNNNKRSNVRYEYAGEKLTLRQWSQITGLRESTLWMRLHKLLWSVEKAFETPVESCKPLED